MKKLVTVLFTCAFLILGISGCASHSTNSVPVVTLQEKLLAVDTSLPEMITVNHETENAAELFSSLSDVDYGKVDSYFLSYSSEGLADEVAVVRVKSSSDVKMVEDSLKEHVQKRVNLFQSYRADQVNRAENAVVFSNGNDVVLIISDQSGTVKNAYEEASK